MEEALNSNLESTQDFMLGNDAIARGAMEANVGFVAGYPGTPSSEIIKNLAQNADQNGIHVEWSVNEMVAISNAVGASLAGKRAMVTMKHAGFNWIVDALSVVVLSGVRGGLVIVTADDPNCHSSANEQDNRFYGQFLKVLTLEPSDAQEAKDLTREAFELSEKSELPVILRTVTRLSHSRSNVSITKRVSGTSGHSKAVDYKKEAERFYVTGARTMQRRQWHVDQQAVIEKLASELSGNKLQQKGTEKKLIITSGVAYNYTMDALDYFNANECAVLKLASVYPLPGPLMAEAVAGKEEILLVEEGEPFVEYQVRAFAAGLVQPLKIIGKSTGELPSVGELDIDIAAKAIAGLLNQTPPRSALKQELADTADKILPPRTLGFCAGCPHTASMYALKKAIKKLPHEPFIAGDIGCYTLMSYPPFELGDAKYNMGTSIGLASGFSKVAHHKAIAVIGDSTFIHAGIPMLINSVYNQSNLLMVLVDNRTTAMTGAQPNPGTGETATGQKTRALDLAKMITACGVDSVRTIDPYDTQTTFKTMKAAVAQAGVNVVIARRACALMATRESLRSGEVIATYSVDPDTCIACGTCLKTLSCPAMGLDGEKTAIETSACVGCGVCAQVCPVGAIA